MKVIGLIGGLSWESSAAYYRIINREVHRRLRGSHSARILMMSIDFHELEQLQLEERWDEATGIVSAAAQQLESGGAQCVAICSNTMHRNFEQVAAAVSLPLLHIADATGDAVTSAGLKRVGLMGSRFTMEEAFYKGRLASRHSLEILIPDEADRERVHRIIYDELIHGELRPASQEAYLTIIADLVSKGAQGVILGCTEISLLVKPGEGPVPLFDTTAIHALRIVDWALAND